MLGKLFGLIKNNKDNDKRADAVESDQTPAALSRVEDNPPPAGPATPSRLEQLTGGQPIDSITDADLLHQLVKHSQHLDKKTNRLVRERINALREQDRQRKEQHEQQQKLCTKLETLSRLQHHPLYDSELAHLQQQWQAISTPDAAIAERVNSALVQCQRVQQDAINRKAVAAAAAQEAEQQRLAAEQRAAEQAAVAEAQSAAQQQLALQQKEQQQQSQAEREQHARQQQDIRLTLQRQLQQLESAIDQADSRKARDLLDKARDNLKKLDAKQQHDFDGKLHLLSGQLRDLQDWQAFAALPKLEELCGSMEKLAEADLPPLQKADSIRELQNQWRTTKPPTGKQAQALWERFRQLSDRAWEPCAAYFEKEKQVRAFNLQQRQTICEALEQFFAAQDWRRADWKAVARILEKARQEFHDFHPVERNEEKGIRTRFDAAFAAVNNQLLAEQRANEEKKRQLVDTARNLASMDDVDQAIERVRQLQEQWKQIGLTRRHEDQKLWQALQEQTTLLFDKRRARQQQQRQSEHDLASQARALCDQIVALTALPDAALAHSGNEFDRLQADYKAAVANLPDKVQQPLRKSFHAACDKYREQLAGITRRQHNQQLDELVRRAGLCNALEQGQLDSAALDAQWQQATLPADWDSAIAQRRQRASQPQEHAANEAQLRELCIALEILLDIDTPEEDRPLRREYQLRKLQQGLGQASTNRAAELERLLVRWYCSSPAAPAVQASLQARFDKARRKAG